MHSKHFSMLGVQAERAGLRWFLLDAGLQGCKGILHRCVLVTGLESHVEDAVQRAQQEAADNQINHDGQPLMAASIRAPSVGKASASA